MDSFPGARRDSLAQRSERRERGIESLGGKCAQCGATDDLEIDHIDPATKVSHRIFSWSWARIESELSKCQLLCVPCHFQKTLTYISTAGGTWATRKNHHKKGCGGKCCQSMRQAEVGAMLKLLASIESPEPAIKSQEHDKAPSEEEMWAS